MQDERSKHLAAAYTTPERLKIGHLELRPISIGTLEAVKQLGVTFLFRGESSTEPELTQEEMMRQITALLWFQSQPLDDVLDALEDGTAARKIKRFAWDLPLDMLDAFKRTMAKTGEQAAAAAVEVVPKPSPAGSKAEESPPNS